MRQKSSIYFETSFVCFEISSVYIEIPPTLLEISFSHTEILFKGNKYYSKDVDSHNGGSWKVFEKSGGRLKRVGTADKNLNIFKR